MSTNACRKYINDYREYINILNNNKFIFSPNASGKTMFAEASNSSVFSLSKEVSIGNSNIFSLFYSFSSEGLLQPSSNNDLGDLTDKKENQDPSLNESDLDFINGFLKKLNVLISYNSIETKSNSSLSEIVIKRGNKKVSFKDGKRKQDFKSLKIHLSLSSSEAEMVIGSLVIIAYSNTSLRIILDDPIEVSSGSNESGMISVLRYSFEKSKFTVTILTHRTSFFEKLIGIHKKAMINGYKPTYIYFMDSIPHGLNNLTSDFVRESILQNNKENHVLQRLHHEEVRHTLKFLESVDEVRRFEKYINNQIDYLSQNKKQDVVLSSSYKKTTLANFISIKFDLITVLREKIKKACCSKTAKPIKSLKKIKINNQNFRKRYSKNEVKYLFDVLNEFSHHSKGLMFNEISILDIIELVTHNFNFKVGGKDLQNFILKMQKWYDNVIANSLNEASYPLDFLEDLENKLSISNCGKKTKEGVYVYTENDSLSQFHFIKFIFNQGSFIHYKENAKGEFSKIGLKELSTIFQKLESNK